MKTLSAMTVSGLSFLGYENNGKAKLLEQWKGNIQNKNIPSQNNLELEEIIKKAEEYVEKNTDRWLEEYVKPFVAIESISEPGENKQVDEYRWNERKKALEFLADKLKKLDIIVDDIYVREGGDEIKDPNSGKMVLNKNYKRNMFLIAHRKSNKDNALTLLQYGHADVKPETIIIKPEDKWTCGSPTQLLEAKRPLTDYIHDVEIEINGKKVKDKEICARGAEDDKSQLLTYLFAAETYLALAKDIPINLKFLFEVGEEIGSPLGKEFVKEKADLLKADAVIIEDGESARYGVPFIGYWLRGIIKGNILLKVANNSGHSGSKAYLPNAIKDISRIIAQIEDPITGKVIVEGFYDGIIPLTKEDKSYFKKQLKRFGSEEDIKKKFELERFQGEKEYGILERTTQRPCFDVHNIIGGSNSTLIPNTLDAYFTVRIVPGQDPLHVYQALEKRIKEIAKNLGMKENEIKVELKDYVKAFHTSLERPIYKIISESLKKGYKSNEIDYLMSGGTEPISPAFSEYIISPRTGKKADIIMTGWGDKDSNAHAKNERILIKYGISMGIISNIIIYYNLSKYFGGENGK